MARSLVLGGNGQDGGLLAELLVAAGGEVVSVGRQEQPRWPVASPRWRYRRGDLCDVAQLDAVLEAVAPDEIYHVAAVHGAAGFQYEPVWDQVLDVNVKSLHRALEYARCRPEPVRLFYASSCKLFGTPLQGRIGPDTPWLGSCLYSVSKRAAHGLIDHYRRAHGVAVATAILFNHDSPRRAAGYFLPEVVSGLRRSLADPSHRITVNTLDFYCDWGCAREYMDLAIELTRRPGPLGDVLFATGSVHYGRDFVADLYARHGLDWREHVRESRPGRDAAPFSVDLSATAAALGRLPRRGVFDICGDMLQEATA